MLTAAPSPMPRQLPSQRCLLLDLPTELRLEIYDHLFDSDQINPKRRHFKVCSVQLTILDNVYLVDTNHDLMHKEGLALLLSCKTSRPFFDADTVYRLDIDPRPSRVHRLHAANDLGPVHSCDTLRRVKKAKLSFYGCYEDGAVLNIWVAALLEAMDHFRGLQYLCIDFASSAFVFGTADIWEALHGIKSTGVLQIRASGSQYSIETWKAIKETAEKIGASVSEKRAH